MLASAAEGAIEGNWLRAERQSAGRGRMGRNWTSPPGNLYASTLVRLRRGDPPAATLGFVAAVALDQVITAYIGERRVQIKWPNDIMAENAKLSGILLERAGDAVVIGFGVNLASHPQLDDRTTTSLAALGGVAPDPSAFLADLAAEFSRALYRWRALGLGAVLAAWQRRAHPPGTALIAALPDGERMQGLYDGLDGDGALMLRLADGAVRAIHAADVFLI